MFLHEIKTVCFSFYQGFHLQTLATHRTEWKGRGPSFIPLYNFHLLTNIQTFICNLVCEMTLTYLEWDRQNLLDCYSMRFTTLSNYQLIDWWCGVYFCLFTWWIDSRFLLPQRKTVGLGLRLTTTLVLQADWLIKCAPKVQFYWCL